MKVTITRLLDTAKILGTDVGQKLTDMVSYLGEFCDLVIRCLRNGLTFADNVDCTVKTVSLTHDIQQVVGVDKTVKDILFTRVMSDTYLIGAHGWFYNSSNQLVVRVQFTGSPTTPLDVRLVILY